MVNFNREVENNRRAREILALFDLLPTRHKRRVLNTLQEKANDTGDGVEEIEA